MISINKCIIQNCNLKYNLPCLTLTLTQFPSRVKWQELLDTGIEKLELGEGKVGHYTGEPRLCLTK